MNNTIIIAQRAYDCTSVSVNNISKACKEIQELSLHCNNITELCNSMDTPTICNALSLLLAGWVFHNREVCPNHWLGYLCICT